MPGTELHANAGNARGNVCSLFVAGGQLLVEGGISVRTEYVGGQHPYVNKLVVGFAAAQDISTNLGSVRKRVGRYLEK